MLEDDDSWSARLRRLIRRMLSRCSVWSRVVGCSFLFRTVKPQLAITTTDVSARCAPSRGCVFMYFNLILFVVVVIQWCNDSDSSDKNPAYTHGSLLQVPTTLLSVSATADDVDLVVAVDQIRLQNIWHTPHCTIRCCFSTRKQTHHWYANFLLFRLFFLPVTLTLSPKLTD